MKRLVALGVIFGVLALVALLPAGSASAADPGQVDHIARLLRTPDQCGQSVYDCAGLGDSMALTMKSGIADQLDQGMSEGEVLDWFAARYGQDVLLAPKKEGFGLLAYVVPVAVALVLALVLVVPFVKMRRRRRAGEAPADVQPPPEAADPGYRERVERELRSME